MLRFRFWHWTKKVLFFFAWIEDGLDKISQVSVGAGSWEEGKVQQKKAIDGAFFVYVICIAVEFWRLFFVCCFPFPRNKKKKLARRRTLLSEGWSLFTFRASIILKY